MEPQTILALQRKRMVARRKESRQRPKDHGPATMASRKGWAFVELHHTALSVFCHIFSINWT